MYWTSKAVVHVDDRWTVTAESSEGDLAAVSCSSEAQALYFAAVLALKPRNLPRESIVRQLRSLAPTLDAKPRTSVDSVEISVARKQVKPC